MMKFKPLMISLCFFASVVSGISFAEPKSGYFFLQQSTQEMQDDEFANPGMTFVDRGRNLFKVKGDSGKSCMSCHGEEGSKLDSKRIAQYPIYSKKLKKPVTLQNRINMCVEDKLDNIPYVPDCIDLVALETFVRYLARGEKVNVDTSGPMKKFYEAGKKLYHTRYGQANMACVHCHVNYSGQKLRGQTLSQGQSNGFPEYRLGSAKVTSLHQRIRQCFVSFRAQPYDSGSDALVNLEVFLHARGNGLKIETPAVRY